MDNMKKSILRYSGEIQEIVFIFRDEHTIDLINFIYQLNWCEKIILITEDSLLEKKAILRLKKTKENSKQSNEEIITTEIKLLNKIENLETNAIFFDTKIRIETLLDYDLKAKFLFGHIWCDSLPYFSIWEKFRTISKHIEIQRVNLYGKLEVLLWEKSVEEIELSVIFPVYKVRDYLKKCIETVTAWKAPYVEFLFVNDGSPDDSAELISEYQKKDSRIKLLNKENGGCASARRYGLEHAKGRYVGFVDPDDFIDPSMFKKLLSRALMGNYQISYSGYFQYYESTKLIEKVSDPIGEPYSNGITDLDLIRDLIIYRRIAIWRGIYRRDFLEDNNISFNVSFKRFDDLPFKVETLMCAKSVVSVPEYLYYYRLDRPGQDVSCNDKRLYVHFDIFAYLDGITLKKNDQKLIDYLQVLKVQTHTWALQIIQEQYSSEYTQKAKQDLLKNCPLQRTIFLVNKHLGKEYVQACMAILLEKPWVYQKQFFLKLRNEEKKVEKEKKILRSLENLYQR